jgi:hypothetical protein
MRFLVIQEKAATPKIHQYKSSRRLDVRHSDGRIKSYHALAAHAAFGGRQFISKINGKQFA